MKAKRAFSWALFAAGLAFALFAVLRLVLATPRTHHARPPSTAVAHAPPERIPLASWVDPLIDHRTPLSKNEILGIPSKDGNDYAAEHLFAAYVRVRDESTGERVIVGPDVWGFGPTYRFLDSKMATSVTDVSLSLAEKIKVPGEALHLRDDRLLIYSAEQHHDRLGPILYEVSVPGYEPVFTDNIYLDHIEDGIPSYVIYTHPITSEWGAVRVTWADKGPMPNGAQGSTRSVGAVFLYDTTREERRELGYLMIHLPLADESFDFFPAGTYFAQFRSSDWPYEFPVAGKSMLLVEVHANSVATIELSAANTGVLVLTPPEEVRSAGWIVSSIDKRHAGEWLIQTERPFSLAFLWPGTYNATMKYCNGEYSVGDPLETTVRANEVSIVSYPVPRQGR